MSQFGNLLDKYEDAADSLGDSLPFIRDYKGALWLHLNAFQVQSAMQKSAPHELFLSYTRTMMGFLAFHEEPSHIGMIGLGGGSMAKYCYHHLPDTKISVAEINSEVIAFRDRFFIPRDNQRFAVCCEDGAEFVRRHTAEFDVLLVDGFDEKGQPTQLCSNEFYDACFRALTSRGILVVNAFDDQRVVSRIRRSFRNQVVVTDGGDNSSNIIVFAGKGNVLVASPYRSVAEKISQYGLSTCSAQKSRTG